METHWGQNPSHFPVLGLWLFSYETPLQHQQDMGQWEQGQGRPGGWAEAGAPLLQSQPEGAGGSAWGGEGFGETL